MKVFKKEIITADAERWRFSLTHGEDHELTGFVIAGSTLADVEEFHRALGNALEEIHRSKENGK